MKIIKTIIMMLLRVGISIGLLVFLFRYVDIDRKSLIDFVRAANKPILFAGFAVLFLSYALCFARWWLLLVANNVNPSLWRVITAFCGGIFFTLLPSSTIGGDVVRSIDLAAHTQRPRQVVATVFLDRLSGYVGLVILALVSLMLGWNLVSANKFVLLAMSIIVSILVAILVVIFNSYAYTRITQLLKSSSVGRIREAILKLHHEMHLFGGRKKTIIESLIISLFVQAVSPISFYLIASALGIKINIIYFFVYLPIIGAITLLPITVGGGLGLREWAMVLFFAKSAPHLMDEHFVGAMSLMLSFFVIIYGVLGGLVYVLTVHRRRIQRTQPSILSPQTE